VSIYNQIIANTDTKGTDAKIAPISELRLAISDIATTRRVVTAILIRY